MPIEATPLAAIGTTPRPRTPTIMEDIAAEIDELIRAMEMDDREGLGLVARNHIFRSMTYLSR